jgi:hypothetical protein
MCYTLWPNSRQVIRFARNYFCATEQNQEDDHSRYCMAGPRFEPGYLPNKKQE